MTLFDMKMVRYRAEIFIQMSIIVDKCIPNNMEITLWLCYLSLPQTTTYDDEGMGKALHLLPEYLARCLTGTCIAIIGRVRHVIVLHPCTQRY